MSTINTEPSKFVWYELHSPDVRNSESFYTGVLGWGARDSGMPDRCYTVVSAGSTPIGGLLQKPEDTLSMGSHWVGYIGVDDVDAYAQRLKKVGGTVNRASEDIPNVGRFSVVTDPQGAMFVLFQPHNGMAQPPEPKPGTPGTAAWHDLAAADWQSDFAFYADLFGWTKAEPIDMGPKGIYQIFAIGENPSGGMMNRPDPSVQPGWMFYFNVEEIGAAVARVQQHGGKITYGPAVVPGGRQIAQCLDPQGALFGMVGPPQG